MDTQKLRAMLGSLSGHLSTESPQQERAGEDLHQLLSRSLLPEDMRQVKRSSFAFEQADLFFAENIPEARAEAIRAAIIRGAEAFVAGRPDVIPGAPPRPRDSADAPLSRPSACARVDGGLNEARDTRSPVSRT